MIVSELLTLLVITSPVRAHPATDVLDHVVGSFPKIQGLQECPKYIVCDGYRLFHKDCFKAGKITAQTAEHYEEYKVKLKEYAKNAELEPTNPWYGMEVVEMEHHLGFSFTVKYALDHLVETPYIFLVQHDRPFLRDFNLELCLNTMENHPEIKYLGLKTPKTRHLRGGTGRKSRCEGTIFTKGELQVYELWFWYDSNHLCRTSKYQELFQQRYQDYLEGEAEEFMQSVFPHIQELAKRGRAHEVSPEEVLRLRYRPLIRKQEFFEDVYGQLMKKHLPYALQTGGERRAEEVHTLYGAYLLDTGNEDIVCHYDGRKYRTSEQTQEIISYNHKHQKFSGRGSRRFQKPPCQSTTQEIDLKKDGLENMNAENYSKINKIKKDKRFNGSVHSNLSTNNGPIHSKNQMQDIESGNDIHIQSIWQEDEQIR